MYFSLYASVCYSFVNQSTKTNKRAHKTARKSTSEMAVKEKREKSVQKGSTEAKISTTKIVINKDFGSNAHSVFRVPSVTFILFYTPFFALPLSRSLVRYIHLCLFVGCCFVLASKAHLIHNKMDPIANSNKYFIQTLDMSMSPEAFACVHFPFDRLAFILHVFMV